MKRITYYLMKGSENDGYYLKPGVSTEEARWRLGEIESVLGDNYNIDELKRIIEAIKDGRCFVLPKVDESSKECLYQFLQDLFTEWSYEDRSVGLFGMSDGERELANALISALQSRSCD